MKRIYAALAILALGLSACHSNGQVQPSPPPSVALTCTQPSSCGGSNGTCTYVFSRASCTGSTQGTCATTFTPLNQSSPSATCSYTDSAPPTGISVSYVAQTIQSGLTGQPSAPVNNSVPLAIPIYPGTPGTLNGTQTAALAPPLVPNSKPAPEIAACKLGDLSSGCVAAPLGLTAKLEK